MNLDGFVVALMSACARLEGVTRVEPYGRDKIRITADGEGMEAMVLSIGNFYIHYRQSGDLEAAIARPLGMVRALLAEQHRFGHESFRDVQAQIFPKLELLDQLDDGKERLFTPWLAGLGISFVVDAPTHTRAICAPHAARWGVDRHKIEWIAYTNLRTRVRTTKPERMTIEGSPLWLSRTNDGFDATRILLPEVLTTWFTPAEQRQGILIAIPNRDLLIATTKSKQNHLALVGGILTGIRRPYRLTAHVFTIDQRGQLALFPQEGDLSVN